MLEVNVDDRSDGAGHVVVAARGELDAFGVGAFRDAMGEVDSAGSVVLDLSAVSFVDSAGIGALVGVLRRARDAAGRVVLVSDRDQVVRLLHTAGVDRLVSVVPTVEAASAALDEFA